jgi:hypothetical protein
MMLLASAGADVLSRHIGWSRVGLPPDAIAWAALFAALAVALAFPRFVATARARRFAIGTAAAAAAALSAGYVSAFLRGGPRIIDATTYYLEARGIANGAFAWSAGEPTASVAGRFLVRPLVGDVAGIFPPGYPAWLSIFVKLGAPMASGPALAALVVVATAWLAREVATSIASHAAPSPVMRAQLALLPVGAAWLSAGCAALRYHTADTMSHGLAALAATVALAAALTASRDLRVAPRLVIGASLGVLFATRPVSAAAITMVCAAIVVSHAQRDRHPLVDDVLRTAKLVALGAAPGVALFVLHQHAATGAWLMESSQSLYYADSDGPADCFRYGFGDGVGCEHEHGTFVLANLPDGYGAYAALATSMRRLKAHLVDPLSSEPAFLLVIVGLVAALRGPRAVQILALAPIALLVAYAPFYFDGNYPGGGARMLADTLPVEHVVAVLGVFAVARRFELSRITSPPRVIGFAIALVFAGFAFRASYDHALLRDREGGVPMFEPVVLARAGIERGLVFVDTDHGFAIGHDPGVGAREGVEVVRRHGDSLDRIAWEARGRPPSFAYALSTLSDDTRAVATIASFEPPAVGLIEGEHLWPPFSQSGAYALPRSAGGPCASGGAWLAIYSPEGYGQVVLDLPRSLAGARVVPRVARTPGVEVDVELAVGRDRFRRENGRMPGDPEGWVCVTHEPLELEPHADGSLKLRIHVAGAGPWKPRVPIAALDVLILDASPY